MKPVIRIQDLSKLYRLGARKEPYNTLRESITRVSKASMRRLQRFTTLRRRSELDEETPPDSLWALKDVTFDVQPGEVVGIVGRNGAGKSTLLKVLSRITEPTSGRVELRGRVGSLLEVGTGFHTELTGRENVFLNGAILGMTRREIARKFEEIIAFAGVEQFLDTPVKYYSSGMYVRLAFAVAAHLQPEILIVDEVLAVGDMEFQRKCLGKMNDVARSGRTVLFVSHNMPAVQNLCGKAVLMARGRAEMVGDCAPVLARYLASHNGTGQERRSLADHRLANMTPIIQAVNFRGANGQLTDTLPTGSPLTIEIHYDSPVPLREPRFGVSVETLTGERLFFLETLHHMGSIPHLPSRGVARCEVAALPLAPGTYLLSFSCCTPYAPLDQLEHARHIHVQAADFFGTGHLPPAHYGSFLLPASWSFDPEASRLESTSAQQAPVISP